ncbi:MAG: TIR domain-containing protein [Bacteroidetes bacterium]|nr:TIR domain-containing protein [Bacteroidota bacterium]
MSKSIFISCVFEDSHRIESIKKWAMNNRLGDVIITHETEDKRPLGKDAIKKHIQSKIEGAAIILVLIGQDTHNHEWIEAEVELANSFHKEIICVRVPQTKGAAPILLANKRLISFDPDAIKKLIS